MYCSNCGNNVQGKRFCNQCGQLNRNYKEKNNKALYIGLTSFIAVAIIVIAIMVVPVLFNKERTRTIMIYMVGADLESKHGVGTVSLDGIDGSKIDLEKNNVVLIAGGAKKWYNDYIDVNETSIFELQSNGFQKVNQQDLKNMGTSEVLSSFLNYVYDNYHTNYYDLIFWNHGAGILGSEFDELNKNDGLNLMEMKQALNNSPFNEKNKLEMVFFSTCLNGTIEVANALKDNVEYMVSSEEITTSSKINSELEFINSVSIEDTSIDIGNKFIESYQKVVSDICSARGFTTTSYCITSTYSILDLSKMDELNVAVDDFFGDINSNISTNYNEIARVRSSAFQYGDEYGNNYEMIDLYDTVYKLKDLSSTKAQKVLDSLKNVVVSNWATDNSSNGLSIYFPYPTGKYVNDYSILSQNNHYNNFIKAFYNYKTGKGSNNFNFKVNKAEASQTSSETADISLELTDEQVSEYAKARYMLFVKEEDDYYRPIRNSYDVSLNGNKLEATIRGKQLRVSDTDLNDGSSYYLLLRELEKTNDYTKYETGILLEDFKDKVKLENAKMEIIVDKDNPNGRIGKIVLTNQKDENGLILPNSTVEDINDYQNVAFISSKYKILDENGKYKEDWESAGELRGVEVPVNDIVFIPETFDETKEYYCIFQIFDTANNSYYSNLIKMN